MRTLDRLSALLDAERSFALSADTVALERIQEEKRVVVGALTPDSIDDVEQYAGVVERARQNVRLIQKLTELHRALLSGVVPTEHTYGPRGASVMAGDGAGMFRRTT